MNIKIKKILSKRNVYIAVNILGAYFLVFHFALAFPAIVTSNGSNGLKNILPYSENGLTDFNKILNFNLQGLIQDSLGQTLNNLQSLEVLKGPLLPLEDNPFITTKNTQSKTNLDGFFNLRSLGSGDIKEMVKSVTFLTFRLFFIAIVSVIQVFRAFIDLI